MLVAHLTNVLKDMIGYDTPLPRVVFTDRGPGFFQGSTGHVVKAYADALKKHGFRPYAGSDASKQPGDVPDCLPHETAVAWARTYMKKYPLSKAGGLDDMENQLAQLLQDAATHINAQDPVSGPLQSFLESVSKIVF